jgi:ankyrin repeat protein
MLKWTFPPLKGPSVFIGSPSDVDYLREEARQEFNVLMHEVADGRGAELYLWEEQTRERDFQHNKPYQGSIPLPAGEHCLAAVFLFGERIGSELPLDFPAQPLDGTPARLPGTRHTLLPRWFEEAGGNGFPLTGSTFEYLVAEIAETPRLVLFVGDDTLHKDSMHVFNQHWGLNRLYRSKHEELQDYELRQHWDINEGIPQRTGLRNFFRYLSQDRGLPVEIVSTEEHARERIRQFLVERLDFGRRAPRGSPFRGLAAYGVDDNDVFFGRNTIRDEIVDAIDDRTRNCRTDRRPFFRIHGASGAGKSSLMRAGIVARLSHQVSRGNWIPHVARPGDLAMAVSSDAERDALVPLFVDCLAKVNGSGVREIDAKSLSRVISDQRPETAVEYLLQALDRRHGSERKGPWRLILGIDQLEECLEDLNRSSGSATWDNLIAFLDHATRTARIAVVYTIPISRLTQMNEYRVLRELSIAGAEKLVGFPNETVQQIIDLSFAKVGAELAPDLRQELLTAIEELSSSARGDDQGAILPLLSMAMTSIYERWQDLVRAQREEEAFEKATERARAQLKGGPGLSAEFAAAESSGSNHHSEGGLALDAPQGRQPIRHVLPLETYRDLAELGSVIDREGDAAINSAKQAARGLFIDDETLPVLLRSLVRFKPGDPSHFDLQAIAPPRDRVLQLLANSLRRHRLVVETREGRLRLVHEAVLSHWKAAASWVAKESRRLDYVSGLTKAIRVWEESGRSPAAIAALGTYDMEGAAEVLYAWATTVAPVVPTDDVNEKHQQLRDFLIAIVRHLSAPAEQIVKLDSGPTHFHAAVAADAKDLVNHFLHADIANACLTRRKDGRTALFEAAFLDRLEIIEELLRAGAPANTPDKDGWLPLHAAATRGSVRAIRALVPLVEDINAGGLGHLTALHSAAANGHGDSLRVLLEHGAKPDVRDDNGWTPLHSAAVNGHAEAVRLLLEGGADINARLAYEWTGLHLAAQEGHDEVAEVLLKRGVEVDSRLTNGWTPLHIAARHGRELIIARLIANQAALDARGNNDWRSDAQRAGDKRHTDWIDKDWTPLHIAAEHGQQGVARILLESGADVNARNDQGQTALHIAVEKGHRGFIQLLLGHDGTDADPRNNEKRTPLQTALKNSDYAAAQVLVNSRRVKVDAFEAKPPIGLEHEWAPLHFAATSGDERRAEFLLANGADPNARNHDGWGPLALAVRHGREKIASLLLGCGARIDENAGLLHLAAEYGHENIAEWLITNGAAADSRDATQWTPLHVAAQNGHESLVRLLLAHGADKEAISAHPALTPLQAAAETGQQKVVAELLEQGADLHARTVEKPEALILAVRNAQYETALLLLDAGADVHAMDGAETVASLFAATRAHRIAVGAPATEFEAALADRLVKSSLTPGKLNVCLPIGAEVELKAASRIEASACPGNIAVSPSPNRKGILLTGSPDENYGNFAKVSWQLTDPDTSKALTSQLNPVYGIYPLEYPRTQVWSSCLSFYENVVFLRVRDPHWEIANLFTYFLMDKGNLYPLNGTSLPVHEVNLRAPIRLNETNVLDYLRFFCFFVRGEGGPFYFVERLDDPFIPDHPVIRQILSGTIRAATLEGVNEHGFFMCDAVVYYSNALFLANFMVQPSGMIEMLEDEPIAADLPMKIDAPIT